MSGYGKDMVATREILEKDPAAKWGFVIYRCTYTDDEEWARFMDYLNTRTRLNLESEGNQDLFEQIDWLVQEDREKFDGAGAHALRRHFTTHLLPTLKGPKTSRHHAFIAVFQTELSCIFSNAPPSHEFDAYGDGFVDLISADESEGDMFVGVSYLVPRVYTLLDGCGWYNFYPREGGVACP